MDAASILDSAPSTLPPTTLTCGGCERIIGDSSSLVCVSRPLSALSLRTLTSTSLSATLSTAPEGAADEFCTFRQIHCGKCGAALGKRYFATTPRFAELVGAFTVLLDRVALYTHGSGQCAAPVIARGEREGRREEGEGEGEALLQLVRPRSEDVTRWIEQIMSVAVGLREEQEDLADAMGKLVQRVEGVEKMLREHSACPPERGTHSNKNNNNNNNNPLEHPSQPPPKHAQVSTTAIPPTAAAAELAYVEIEATSPQSHRRSTSPSKLKPKPQTQARRTVPNSQSTGSFTTAADGGAETAVQETSDGAYSPSSPDASGDDSEDVVFASGGRGKRRGVQNGDGSSAGEGARDRGERDKERERNRNRDRDKDREREREKLVAAARERAAERLQERAKTREERKERELREKRAKTPVEKAAQRTVVREAEKENVGRRTHEREREKRKDPPEPAPAPAGPTKRKRAPRLSR